ncbi:MAG TPA: chitinase, partial [Cytophagales bacterium]|nr:chitinase [Cytophagales bacterium]
MKKTSTLLFLGFLFALVSKAQQVPNPSLVGYWQNWNDAACPYINLDASYGSYNVIEVSFAVPTSATNLTMKFTPTFETQSAFITRIKNLQSQGKKVLISLGGANDPVTIDTKVKMNAFVSSMNTMISNYGFDGLDIDFETTSLVLTGGSIASPKDSSIIYCIAGVRKIMENYRKTNGNKKLLWTMAPETAYVQGGMSNWGLVNGISWGAYLPVIEALRDSIDILQVQLYNSGSMFGIDGKVYSTGTADFITSMTEAVIQ